MLHQSQVYIATQKGDYISSLFNHLGIQLPSYENNFNSNMTLKKPNDLSPLLDWHAIQD